MAEVIKYQDVILGTSCYWSSTPMVAFDWQDKDFLLAFYSDLISR